MKHEPRLVIFSGAGLSADSGIPTFRDDNGLWENHSVDVVANGLTWKNNWDTVRNFYNERRTQLAQVEPNAMHYAISKWSREFPSSIITQNIDDLLERAGCENVIHLHGKLREMRCEACGHVWDIEYQAIGATDRCVNKPKCDSLKGVRPNVVFFNENAPYYAVMYQVFKNLQPQDCVLVVGTSGIVINLDSLLFDAPCLKILNNLEPCRGIDTTIYDHAIFGKAADKVAVIEELIYSNFKKGS